MEKTEELLKELDNSRMPRHIAIIMDGNGRWAKQRGLPRLMGHRKGAEVVREIVRFTVRNLKKVEVLTLYVFSTENWSRPKVELKGLMNLLQRYLHSEIAEFNENNVRLNWIGRKEKLSQSVLGTLKDSLEKTSKNTGLILNLAINYGGRTEIIDAVKEVIARVDSGENSLEIDEKNFESFLYTKGLPPLDLLIRTGGEMRISNFLLWQIAYAELWVTPVCWPDFTPAHLLKAIFDYQERERRFGKI